MTDKYRQGRRRRMDKFALSEVSFVDRPAQSPALARISKREDDEDIEKGGDLVQMLTGSTDGHQHGLRVHGDGDGLYIMVHFAAGPDGEMHDHQVVRTSAGQYVMSENRGHTHAIDQEELMQTLLAIMAKAEDENSAWAGVPMQIGGVALADLPEVQKASNPETVEKEITDMTDEAKKAAEDRIAALEAQNATLSKVAALPAAHKAYYDALDEKLDDDARKAFLDASAEKRQELVDAATAKAAETKDEDIVYKADNGDVFRKSDDPRLVKMAKERDEERRESIRLRKAAEDADLTKRAEGDLANFPGDVKVRKAILKAVDTIDDAEVRKAAHDALKAQNAKMAKAFEVVGTSATVDVEKSATRKGAEDELDRLAKEHAAKHNVDFYTAYEKVSEANPELLAKAVG